MGSEAFLEIVFFAALAAVLIYRLRSILGQRHGEEEQRHNPFAGAGGRREDNVTPLPERRPPPMPVGGAAGADDPLAELKAADRYFDEATFLEGAKRAFEMIVGALAAGDMESLRGLLAPPLERAFRAETRRRQDAGDVHETRITLMRQPVIEEARVEGRVARVRIRYSTQQIQVVRDRAGTVIDGAPDESVDVTDLWTFTRDLRSSDPNWQLAETRSAA